MNPPAPTQHAASIFILPNLTFVAELVAFVIILAVLWRYVVPPIQRVMVARQDMIRAQIEESRETKEKLAAADAAYQNALTEARTQAAQIRESARADAQRILEEVQERSHAEADRITAQAQEQLVAERRQVFSQLRTQIGELSVQLASRIVGESLDEEARRRRTVDRFLDNLDQMPPVAADSVGTEPGVTDAAEHSVETAGSH